MDTKRWFNPEASMALMARPGSNNVAVVIRFTKDPGMVVYNACNLKYYAGREPRSP